jgi:hypothetical protein
MKRWLLALIVSAVAGWRNRSKAVGQYEHKYGDFEVVINAELELGPGEDGW